MVGSCERCLGQRGSDSGDQAWKRGNDDKELQKRLGEVWRSKTSRESCLCRMLTVESPRFAWRGEAEAHVRAGNGGRPHSRTLPVPTV
jgi:hypothetical protein